MYRPSENIENHSYRKLDLSQSRIVLRTCLNVTVDEEGRMEDRTRFEESLPLIRELALTSENLVITAHLGRPVMRDKQNSLWHVAEELQKSLINDKISVHFVQDLTDKDLEKIQNNINSDTSKEIFLLENVRFFEGEDSKDKEKRLAFAKQLAGLGDIFINDAFADYKASASTYDIATLLPSYLGPVYIKEVESLAKFNESHELVSVLGGAKLSEKLDALNALAKISDKVVVGGAMAYTILKAKGIEVGDSLVEEDKLDVAKEILEKYSNKLVLPIDHLVAKEFSEEASKNATNTKDAEIPVKQVAIDIGAKTIELFKDAISSGKYVLWNGPMGVFEWDKSAKGTLEIGKAIETNNNAYKLAGGGDSIAAINKLGLTGFNHICTGGGAMLAFIAYDKFPTLDVIVQH